MRQLTRFTLLIVTLVLLAGRFGLADDDAVDESPGSVEINFFETNIRPILVKHCYECHSAEADVAEGGLRVDSRAAIRRGGERGPAVVPRRLEASLLLTAVTHADDDLIMPPEGDRLPDSVIADLQKWIRMGAPDPRTDDTEEQSETWGDTQSRREHWAYQSPVAAESPAVSMKAWPRDSVDAFILATLEDRGLSPAPDASPAVLLRRLYFDVTGLPPSPEQVADFVVRCDNDGVDAALSEEVDVLLASPQFGERWGRHWLDVARFGESSGKESNISFPYAWRYRDYVIDSVNADTPYDRFLTEQIAGDLLPFDADAERARLLVATGFLAIGTKNLGERNDRQFKADVVDEQIDTLSRAVTASTIACARCHHHKFDPFTMDDYYGLAGIFGSTETYFGTFTSPANNRGGHPLPLPRVDGEQILHKSLSPKEFARITAQVKELREEAKRIQAYRAALFTRKEPKERFSTRDILRNLWSRSPLEGKLETVDDEGKAIPVAMGVLDAKRVDDARLLARGEISRPGEKVPRGFPDAMPVSAEPPIPDDTSGRLELARWLTDAKHPLTSRVLVNRVWHHLFGAGLVRTVDNFGTTGEMPSHPELLDTLALEFVEDGWSLKRLVRRIVLTRAYRQASDYNAASNQKDPENRLLWRMPKRRLQAEAIRDAMLAVTGELDTTRPVGSLVGRKIGDGPMSLIGLRPDLPVDLDGSVHRSVYMPVIRDRLPDVLEVFDFAEPGLVMGAREQTNVPLQAFYLMNSPFVQERAKGLAERLHRERTDDESRVEYAFQLCFTRNPDADERARAIEFLANDIQDDVRTDKAETESSETETLMSFCQALLSTAEFRNLD